METLYIEPGWQDRKAGYISNPSQDTRGCPCDGCPMIYRCTEQQLACSRFEAWTNGRKVSFGRFDRIPSRAVFDRL